MDTHIIHIVVKGDTLSALAKKYNTTVTELKKANKLTSDLIKIGQRLQIPLLKPTNVQPTTTPQLKFPFIIVKSPNNLFGNDSKHSKGGKLPDGYYTYNGKLYSMSKDELGKVLIDLMEYGSANSHGIFEPKYENSVVKMAKEFLKNKSYSLSNTYSDKDLIRGIRRSDKFENYRSFIERELKRIIKSNNNKITQGKILLSGADAGYLHFQKEFSNYLKTGLIIGIDQVSHIEVELNDVVYKNGIPSKLKTTFILYDTYGLDMEDMKKFASIGLDVKPRTNTEYREALSRMNSILKERDGKERFVSAFFGYYFSCWWVLQYYHDCVPLLVKLRVENVEINL